jgi:flagellar hook-associated protein 3 FlgL
MAVSDLSLFTSTAFALDNTTSNLQQIEQQMATGKSVIQPSDDPTAYASADILSAQQSALSNDNLLGQQVQAQLSTADNALSGVATSINSAISIATQGSSGTVSTSDMATLGSQVESLLQQVIGAANSQYGGSYLFAGNQIENPPYDSTGNYSGDNGSNSVTFSDGTSVQTNFDGSSIFGDSSSGLIGTLTSLASALNSGNQSAVAAALPQLQDALTTVATARGNLGTGMDAVTAMTNNATAESTTLQSSISNLVDADVPQEAAQEQQTLLQQEALISLSSSLAQVPLVNILA